MPRFDGLSETHWLHLWVSGKQTGPLHGIGTVPAVIEGGPRRRESQAFAEFVPLPGHVTQLEQDSLHPLLHLVGVHVGGWRGGGFSGRTCGS